MKSSIICLGVACWLAAACSSESLVNESPNLPIQQAQGKRAISFALSQKNMTRAASLQSVGHYNFGVFAYKSTDAEHSVMDNYLVGYMDSEAKKGYYLTASNQSTLGDAEGQLNGKSLWAYEKMGNTEYSYVGAEGYYTKDQTAYMSNKATQTISYWDLSAPTTTFVAYAPYINGAGTATYNPATQVLSIPDGSMKAAYDNTTDNEYMYAVSKVASANYGQDVELQFKRLTSKINIKFWEDIDGYSVRILDLGGTNACPGVQAAPAERTGTAPAYTYAKSQYISQSGITINLSGTEPVLSWATGSTSQQPLVFQAPEAQQVGTTRLLATPSPTSYYAIPQTCTGFTFHVTFELTSDTGERIVVNNATVFVPATVTDWKPNYHYTYYFKINTGSNGSTATPGEIDPTDPNVPQVTALYPIVFDNCTVEEWTNNESDHDITPGTQPNLYQVLLDKAVVTPPAVGTVTVTPTLKKDGETIAAPAGTWSLAPADAAGVTINATTGVVSVAAGAAAGSYTIIYHPGEGEEGQAAQFQATFTVTGSYSVTLSTNEVGTGGLQATTFTATTKLGTETETTPAGQLSIGYPAGLTGDQQAKVHINGTTITVERDAKPGVYKVLYTVDANVFEAAFEVKNYGILLSSYLVNLSQENQTITVTANGGGVASLEAPTGATGVSLAGTTITVTPDATPGVYTVKNTVDKSGSVTVYQETFEVRTSYALSLDKTEITGTGTITITASKNGLTETTADNLELVSPAEVVADRVVLSGTTITVHTGATPATYKVNYKDGTTIVKTVSFVVRN